MAVRRGTRRAESTARRAPDIDQVVTGRAWVGGRVQPVEIGIGADGRIVAMGRTLRGGPRRDYGDQILLPAATDLHVHFREPSPDAVEDLSSGSAQAALGGVALVADMPNTEPPMDSVERLESKAAGAQGRLAVDLAIYALARPGLPIDRLARSAASFKLFESPTTAVPEAPTADAIGPLLQAVARTGLPLTVHAEDPGLFRNLDSAASLEEWSAARPLEAERRGVERLLPAPPALRLHVAHVTSAPVAERLRAEGHSFEVTPQHLLLSTRGRGDARWKVNPPLRAEPIRQDLWEAFARGQVPIVASDHAPHSAEAKSLPFAKAPSGVPGVATLLPLLLEEVRSGRLELATLLAAACDRPARWLGAPIGRLSVGHRADLIVVDFRERTPLEGRRIRPGVGWTPFEGRSAVFPRVHLRAGVPIVEDGEFLHVREGTVHRPEFAPDVIAGVHERARADLG